MQLAQAVVGVGACRLSRQRRFEGVHIRVARQLADPESQAGDRLEGLDDAVVDLLAATDQSAASVLQTAADSGACPPVGFGSACLQA